MPTDYSNAIIYKIESVSDPAMLPFIGSTSQSLKSLEAMQKGAYEFSKQDTSRKISYFPLFEKGDVKYTILEQYPCKTRKELGLRTKHYITTIPCINKIIYGRSTKERYQDKISEFRSRSVNFYYKHKDKVLKQKKQYYQKNKARSRQYYQNNKARSQQYYQDNKEKFAEYRKKYKAKKLEEKKKKSLATL